MNLRVICESCKLRIPTSVEASALRKIKKRDPGRFRILSARVCSCPTPFRSWNPPAVSKRKPSLDWYDRKD